MRNKLTSRKFWVMVAAFLGSLGVGIAGITIGKIDLAIVGTICSVLSSALYAAIEASVDRANVGFQIVYDDEEEDEE